LLVPGFVNSLQPKTFIRGTSLTRDTHLMQQFIYYYKQLYMFRASISIVLDTIWSSIIRIQPNTPEDGHIDARNM